MKCRDSSRKFARKGIYKKCENCVNYFYSKPSSNQKYCSNKCRYSSSKKREKFECKNCKCIFEKPFSTKKWANIRNTNISFCSKKCEKEFNRGENHRLWIKDRSKLKNQFKSIRESDEMKNWRNQVFKRDDYTCKFCGERSKSGNPVTLNCHHILRFIDEENLRFNVDNGITLCEICHNLTKGKEKQYQEFFTKCVLSNRLITLEQDQQKDQK